VKKKEDSMEASFDEYVNGAKEALDNAFSAYIPPEIYERPLSPEYMASRLKDLALERFLAEYP
jgi:hypothetical protein